MKPFLTASNMVEDDDMDVEEEIELGSQDSDVTEDSYEGSEANSEDEDFIDDDEEEGEEIEDEEEEAASTTTTARGGLIRLQNVVDNYSSLISSNKKRKTR